MVQPYRVVRHSHYLQWTARTDLRAPYGALTTLFGRKEGPTCVEFVRMLWLLESAGTPSTTFVVHDYTGCESVADIRSGTPFHWVVRGTDEGALKAFCEWVSRGVMEHVRSLSSGRRLTAASRERINAMVRDGMSAAEAMKQAAEWTSTARDVSDFVWPREGRGIKLERADGFELLNGTPRP